MKIFYAVYIHRSLVRSAQVLNVTRSAVSQGLRALEEELHTRLFIRDSKRVLPTDAADLLFRTMEPFLAELQEALVQIETGRKDVVGHLRIGAPQDFGSTHLTEVIVQFRKKHPHVSFELILATPLALLEYLSAGKLDIAFVDNGDVHAKSFPVSAVTVRREKFVLVCSSKYFDEKVKRSTLRFEDLQELDFIDYFTHAPVAKMWIKNHFSKPSPDLKVVYAAESVRGVIRATIGDLGVSVVPEQLIERELKSGVLKRIDANGSEMMNNIVLARRLDRPTSAREKQFVKFYRELDHL